jgi:hypothetical protein
MNTLFSDYSKPAYYYRLFHEGRPKPQVFDFMLDYNMPRYVIQELAGTGVTMLLPPQPLVEDLFLGTPAGKPATTVDPLDGVW